MKEKEDLEAWAWFELEQPRSDGNNNAKLDSNVLHNIDECIRKSY
jgi:hypothetical protein